MANANSDLGHDSTSSYLCCREDLAHRLFGINELELLACELDHRIDDRADTLNCGQSGTLLSRSFSLSAPEGREWV